ncbi:MAG: hypothetical protein GXO54_04570 [Chloroflexi bacterium]|nr:hypothetical protein [Chloroflexota bacterium]
MGAHQIQCPVCGEWNPADAPRCHHCGAPLRPEGDAPASPWPEDVSSPSDWESMDEAEGSETDWLRQILGTELLDEDRSDDHASWLDFSLDVGHTGEAAPDGMSDIQPESPAPSDELSSAASESLEGLPGVEAGLPPNEATLGPWFADAASSDSEDERIDFAEPEAVDEGELPSWLGDLARAEGEAEPEAGLGEGRAEAEGWSWAEAASASEAEAGAEAVDEGELPSWLGDLARAEGEAEPEAGLDEGRAEAAEEPDSFHLTWTEDADVVAQDEDLLPDEVPDWFRDFGAPDETEADSLPAAPPPEAEVPENASAVSDTTTERPAWVDALKPEGADEEHISEPTPPETGKLVFDPDALFAESADDEGETNLAVEGLSEEAVREAAPTRTADMPAWISELAAEESEAEGGTASIVDALAGLPDLLPPDPGLAPKRVRLRPPFKLRLNRHQTERAQWLRALLEDEARPRQIDLPWEGIDLPRGLWRALTLVVLLAFVWLAAWLPAMPPQASADTMQAWSTVEALPPNAPVLVAVDVSWLNVAEMETIARPLLQHLAARESHVVMVTTVPWSVQMGPSWAPSSLRWWEAGFIPGGPVALAQFGQALPFALHLSGSPLDAARVPSWRAVQDWSHIPLVVVLTDNPEILRLWLEQVAPQLPAGTRLVLGVSAQAAPVVEAYRSAVPTWGGAVVGFEGGLAYQQHLQMPTDATPWSMYRALLVAGTAWMFVSALAYGVLRGLRARRRRSKGAS